MDIVIIKSNLFRTKNSPNLKTQHNTANENEHNHINIQIRVNLIPHLINTSVIKLIMT